MQTHDWFTHGDSQSPGKPDGKFEIPLEEDDPWPQEYLPLAVRKTLEDPTRHENTGNPPTFISKVTHWWDASQIYGSEQETIDKLRSYVDGKMVIGKDGLLPLNSDGIFLVKKDFPEAFGRRARALVEEVTMPDLFYSFGMMHPGAIRLHNYPHFLRQLVKDDGEVFDLAAVDILRDRERGIPRYNRFREIIGRGRVKSFEEITSNPQWAKELREVYNNDIDSVDLMVGLFAEDLPEGFGFSDTAFRVFILMASRRLKSDRFFTKDYRAEIYTHLGLDWIDNNSMLTVLRRHYPGLAPAFVGIENGFKPWRQLRTPAR